jgi:HAD superfamily hydrolase (TIGR01509 family)
MPLSALIFDVDGTLAETEEVHRQAFNETFAAAGLDWHWTRDRYRELLRTTGGKERIARHARDQGAALEAEGPRSVAALHRAKNERYSELLSAGGIMLRPGVGTLIEAARQRGLALAIATTTSPENVEALMRAMFGVPARSIFDVVAAGDEVANKKPAPDVYLLALQRLGAAAGQAVAFEDSAVGLTAARAAGLTTIVTPSIYTAGDDFTGALRVLPDLGKLAGGSDTIEAWMATTS